MDFKTAKNFLLDLVFPRRCVGCKKELDLKQVSLICEACFNKINLTRGLQCHVCGLRNGEGACKNCRGKTGLKALYAAGHYQDPVLREMIHVFKYHSIESLKNPIAELMLAYLKKEFLTGRLENAVLAPLPLALRRKINRGFNQSELLAGKLAAPLSCSAVNLLKRKKMSFPQAGISDWQKRKENVAGVFKLSKSDFDSEKLRQKKIILVDDVFTSGATMEEAARVLKAAGFKEIYGLVVAKG